MYYILGGCEVQRYVSNLQKATLLPNKVAEGIAW